MLLCFTRLENICQAKKLGSMCHVACSMYGASTAVSKHTLLGSQELKNEWMHGFPLTYQQDSHLIYTPLFIVHAQKSLKKKIVKTVPYI